MEEKKQLNKSDFITALHEYSGMTKKSLEEYTDVFLEVIKQELSKGNKINLRDFGMFEVVERAEKIGRNPKTGVEVVIPCRKMPKFKPGEDFKRRVSE